MFVKIPLRLFEFDIGQPWLDATGVTKDILLVNAIFT